jgi:tetratricopeptide (TPR) repeat protein
MLVRAIKGLVARLTEHSSNLRARAIAASDEDLDALLLRAGELHNGGDLSAARALYQNVLRRDAANKDALYRLGVIAAQSEDYAGARKLLEKAVAFDPHFVDGWNALANIEKLHEHWEEAERLYHRALALNPGAAAVWSNLGLCLREAGRFDAAQTALQRSLELAPNFAEALLNLATVAVDQGRPQQALEMLHRVLALEPDLAEAHTALAHLLLQNGEFAAGWHEYEWRFKCLDAKRQPQYPFPRWDGTPIKDRVLLVRAEQGLGDQIMFASCLPDAIERVGECLVECEPRLAGLFTRSFPQARVYPYRAKIGPQWAQCGFAPDYQIHLGSLPGLFRRDAADFPQRGAYLHADPVRTEQWREQLARLGPGRKIGISWRGGAPRTRRTLRTAALAELAPLWAQKDTVFVSLQYGDCDNELSEFVTQTGNAVTHWQQALDDYDETAALVSALDLVISVQTAVVHLAGALAKPVWVLVPVVPEWRYMAHGARMPWYPTVNLVRQTVRGDWASVCHDVGKDLDRD